MADAQLLRHWLRRNWFMPVFAGLLAIELAFTRATDWSAPRIPEAVVLFDLCLFIPALYLLCYRSALGWKPLLLRAAALACLGIYLAAKLVPPEAQSLLAELSWARVVGLAVLALIELRLIVLAVRLAFGGRASAKALAERTGAPLWIARLMLAEARFWAWLWRWLRRG